MEVFQVAQELVLVACKDFNDALRFVGVGNKHLRKIRPGSIMTPTEPNSNRQGAAVESGVSLRCFWLSTLVVVDVVIYAAMDSSILRVACG